MKTASSKVNGFQGTLEQKHAELLQVLRNRDGIAIEQSSDQMDFVQNASERDMAIRNVDRESTLLRQVKLALRRIQDGDYGECIDCGGTINPKRLTALPWALRCIKCQEAVDYEGGSANGLVNASYDNAA